MSTTTPTQAAKKVKTDTAGQPESESSTTPPVQSTKKDEDKSSAKVSFKPEAFKVPAFMAARGISAPGTPATDATDKANDGGSTATTVAFADLGTEQQHKYFSELNQLKQRDSFSRVCNLFKAVNAALDAPQ